MRSILAGIVLAAMLIGGAPGREARSSELTLTGAQLLSACTKPESDWIGFCNGYIQAAFDATGGKGICTPTGVTRNQLFDIIIPKLMNSPDLLELDAISVIDAILRKAFPCN